MTGMSGTHGKTHSGASVDADRWRLPWRRWWQRRELRGALARMDAHLWADLGFDEAAAREEMNKPFWVD